MVFPKTWKCQHNAENKTAGRYCTDCCASVNIKIKKVSPGTQKNDKFLVQDIPLAGVIKLNEKHNHQLKCADGLRLLRSTPEAREVFFGYFDDGLTVAEAMTLHARNLSLQDDAPQKLANAAVNPKAHSVYYWNKLWRQQQFGESSIRVLKDAILGRQRVYNAVALVDMIATVWEQYFEGRLLKHANNRVAAHYDKLRKRMPPAGDAIKQLDEHTFQAPSAERQDITYHVWKDEGLCTCRVGQSGGFCKHQALVLERFGGTFPNAPPLTPEDRLELGRLALGDRCPEPEYFGNFRDLEQPSTSQPKNQEGPPDCPQAATTSEAHSMVHQTLTFSKKVKRLGFFNHYTSRIYNWSKTHQLKDGTADIRRRQY
ncbi:hypothetical protein HPB47_014785 [Ixodes persulcatus]|uniref:Uncharacterized protein n=1 Tax=Ixodes persulcatus TaxID=34615 RepID=A0AC60QWH9_IXOPE|nr:hypothetical protein HPB47_014785 [Ixodes persulcatus]